MPIPNQNSLLGSSSMTPTYDPATDKERRDLGGFAMISPTNTVARDWAAKHAGDRWSDISEATRKKIRQVIVRSFEKETRMTDVIREIRVAGEFSQERAATIAQTEVSDAQIRGNWEVWEKSGVVKTVKWLVSADNACPVCLLNKDKIVKFGDPFPSGAIMPTQHPSCRCGLAVVDVAG